MANLPTSLPGISALSFKIKKAQHKSMSESGHVITRARGTKKKSIINVRWNHLTQTQMTTLETWFDNNMGVPFNFTNPESGITYNVVLSEDEMQAEWKAPYYYTAEISMAER